MKLAVLVPRYGPEVLGGAEMQARGLAEEAARRGWRVEVWTTTARAFETPALAYPPGETVLNGVCVRRFPFEVRERERHQALENRLFEARDWSLDEQYAWLSTGVHSPELYAYVVGQVGEFEAVLALPYLSPLIMSAVWLVPRQIYLTPCLHDEQHAYLQLMRATLETVRGVFFNSPEEAMLVRDQLGLVLPRSAVLGEGVSLMFPEGEPRVKPPAPYLLYVGRLEPGKNIGLLYDFIRWYALDGGQLKLVVLGDGSQRPPRHPTIEYRGFVSEEDKAVAYRGALALCQPSLNESFSLTVMEAWLAERPVLVHARCAVTRGHVQRSTGGLWFQDYLEFAAALDWLQSHPAQASRLGRNGRTYVERNYNWPAVMDRFERSHTRWQETGG